MDNARDLWARHAAGDTLAPAEEASLLQALQSDESLRREVIDDARLDGMLDAVVSTDADAGVRQFLAGVAAEKDATRFVRKVESRVRRLRPAQSKPWWILGLAAAALVAVVYFATRAEQKPVQHDVVKQQPPPPVAPPSTSSPRPPIASTQLPSPKSQDVLPPPVTSTALPPPNTQDLQLPQPPKPEPEPTRVAVATIESTGKPLLEGEGIDGAAVLVFVDGTRIESTEGTELRKLSARRVTVEKGAITAKVATPMVFVTPHGEASVLGTTLSIAVDDASTRLEVTEGKVKLTRDRKSVDVKAGQFAVAAANVELVARPTPKFDTLLSYSFEDGKRLPELLTGTVARGPGNRLCVSGAEQTERGVTRRVVKIERKSGLFDVAEEAQLGFDCWMQGGGGTIAIYLWDQTKRDNVWTRVSKLAEKKWSRVTVRLDELRLESDRAVAPATGDVISNVLVSFDVEAPGALHLDNVEVLRPRR